MAEPADTPAVNPSALAARTTPLQIHWSELQAAAQAGEISPAQAERLWQRWSTTGTVPAAAAAQTVAPVRFNFVHVLYYFGGLLAIGAMTLFMTLGWELFGGAGVLLLSLGYGVGAIAVARHLLRRGLRVPAGILATLAVCLVPLATWALQTVLGLWPEGGAEHIRDLHRTIDWRWLTIELATLAAAVVLLWWLRLPFMVMPVAVTLWYLSMDVAHMLMQKDGFDWEFTRDVSLVFGLATCAIAVWVDLRCRLASDPMDRQDFAFWLYLFGALMFWCGLSLRESDSELAKFGYALINVGLVFLGAAIGRRIFTVLGAIGVAGYLGYLSYQVFADSLLFPFVLTLLGLGIVGLGIWWQRHEARLHARLSGWLPAALRPLAGA